MSAPKPAITRLTFRELRIPFTVAFRHAAAERAETATAWVEAIGDDGVVGCGESCPRTYVTGETLATARAFALKHEASLRAGVSSLDTLREWMAAHWREIDENPAAWCAIELALLDLLGKRQRAPVEMLLSMPLLEGRFCYTAVLGDSSPAGFHAMAERYLQQGFTDFKVKLSGDIQRDSEKLAVFKDRPAGSIRVRADANNLWTNSQQAIDALTHLTFPFFAIEEPIGKDRHGDLPAIARALNCRIVLDESFVRRDQLSLLADPPSQWLVNIRVSKMGGLIRSLEAVDAARRHGVGVIVGAQVGETSLLTRAALPVARAAADRLVAQEGAFGTFLLARDTCQPPIMFGKGGVLDTASTPALAAPGLGTFSLEAADRPIQ
jgi:L-Ala-D/L-Glu epimerase / N-acetyl-D-glutamate racemase